MNNTYNNSERIIAAGITRSNDGHVTGLNRNDLIIGGSGSGKTTGYIEPNISNPSGSFVVSDTKGNLYRKYERSLADKGYNVYLIDLVNPEESCGYNPLDYIQRNLKGKPVETDIRKIAAILSPVTFKQDPFWNQAAARIIQVYIGYVLEAYPEEERNMNTVLDVHRDFLTGSIRKEIEAFIAANPDSYTAKKYSQLKGLKAADKTYASVMEFVNESLDPFDCDEYSALFSSDKPFDVHQMGKQKTALFINSSDHDRSNHVLTCVIEYQILQTLIDDADHCPDQVLKCPVNLFLDDFASAAKINDFEMDIPIIRSRNISVSIILQSLSQLTYMYGPDCANTIINNCDTILYLGGGHDQETACFISVHANRTPNTVLCLPRDKAILITSGQKPQIVNKIRPADLAAEFEPDA